MWDFPSAAEMQPKCAHIHGGLQGSELHTGSPGAHPTIRIARVRVCLSDLERGGKKESVQSPVANCLREHRCVQALCFGVPFFSPEPAFLHLPPSTGSGACKPGLKCGSEERGRQDGVG